MNTPKIHTLTDIRKLLAQKGLEYKPSRQARISMTSNQICGDLTEDIAGYAGSKVSQEHSPRTQYAGLEDFERDYHWFLA